MPIIVRRTIPALLLLTALFAIGIRPAQTPRTAHAAPLALVALTAAARLS